MRIDLWAFSDFCENMVYLFVILLSVCMFFTFLKDKCNYSIVEKKDYNIMTFYNFADKKFNDVAICIYYFDLFNCNLRIARNKKGIEDVLTIAHIYTGKHYVYNDSASNNDMTKLDDEDFDNFYKIYIHCYNTFKYDSKNTCVSKKMLLPSVREEGMEDFEVFGIIELENEVQFPFYFSDSDFGKEHIKCIERDNEKIKEIIQNYITVCKTFPINHIIEKIQYAFESLES